jgi:hypothetical protein
VVVENVALSLSKEQEIAGVFNGHRMKKAPQQIFFLVNWF